MLMHFHLLLVLAPILCLVLEVSVFCWFQRHQFHPAFRTDAGRVPNDFGMHHAGVFRCGLSLGSIDRDCGDVFVRRMVLTETGKERQRANKREI